MMAAANGQMEVCVKLAELGANLNMLNKVSEICCNCMSVWLPYHCRTFRYLTSFEGRTSFTVIPIHPHPPPADPIVCSRHRTRLYGEFIIPRLVESNDAS